MLYYNLRTLIAQAVETVKQNPVLIDDFNSYSVVKII